MPDLRHRQLCAAFSQLLAYPRGDVGGLACQAIALAGSWSPCAAAVARFAASVEPMPPTAVEELYTGTFDLEPACTPYLGVQLLGDENPVRGMLLAKLVEVYAAEGFRPREELADHVAEVLGFLAVAGPGPARDDLVADGLLPALDRMIAAFGERPNPYRDLLVAVQALFAAEAHPVNVPAPGLSPSTTWTDGPRPLTPNPLPRCAGEREPGVALPRSAGQREPGVAEVQP
jgi:nitrate reductase molybdenum cofactor assembly chaperone NarJ/NarW